MKDRILTISRSIDWLNESIGKSISWLTLFMVLVMFSIVILRYILNEGSIALQESVSYMHAVVFMLGAAYTLKNDSHVRVDIFYSKMSDRTKAVVNFMGNLLLLLPVCIFIVWSSWDYVMESWRLKESSREAGGLPWIYLLKTSILIMALLLILQAIADMIRNFFNIINPTITTNSDIA